MSGKFLFESIIGRLDLVLLELFNELSFLILHLLSEVSVAFSQLVMEALLDCTSTSCGELRRLLGISVHFLGDVALVDFAEHTGELANALVEEG